MARARGQRPGPLPETDPDVVRDGGSKDFVPLLQARVVKDRRPAICTSRNGHDEHFVALTTNASECRRAGGHRFGTT
jgi:hypothetical protein